jgi:hypothetical protein
VASWPGWQIEARQARVMLTAIRPYTVTKRERVELALEAERVRIAASKHRRPGVGGGSAIADQAHDRLAELSSRIKALNTKGRRS